MALSEPADTTSEIIQHSGLADKTYAALKRKILAGHFEPAQRLRVDTLARQFGVSHTPVKMALNRLLAEGLVRQIPRRGMFVNTLSMRDIEELHDIRLLIEVHAAEQGLPRATEEDIGRLRAALADAEAALQRGQASDKLLNARLNHAFHRMMLEMVGNRRLVEIYDRLIWEEYAIRLARFRPVLPLDVSVVEHRRVLEAYERRDRDALLAAVREHLAHIRQTAFQALAADEYVGPNAGPARSASAD